jgi:hypothetical protein
MADLTAMLQAAAGQAGEEDTDPYFNQTTFCYSTVTEPTERRTTPF